MGWNFSKKAREVVTRDFNQQQLLLARHAAGQIENNIYTLKEEMRLSPAVQYYEKVWIAKRMNIAYSSIRDLGAKEIRLMESFGSRIHIVDSEGYRIEGLSRAGIPGFWSLL